MKREYCLGVLSAANEYHSQLNILVPKDNPKRRANRRKSCRYQNYITAKKVEGVNMPSCVAEQRVVFPNMPHKPKQKNERDNTIHYSVQALAQDVMPNNTPNSRMQTVMSVLSRKTETLKPSGDKRGECIASMLHMLYIMIF